MFTESPLGVKRLLVSLFLAASGLGGAWSQTTGPVSVEQASPAQSVQQAAAPAQTQAPETGQTETTTSTTVAPVAASAETSATAPAAAPTEAQAEVPAQPEALLQDLDVVSEGKGAEFWYYEAKKLELSGPVSPDLSAYIDFLYRLAFVFGPEAEAKEAGRALVQRALNGGDQASALSLASSWIDAFGADWDMYGQVCSAGIAAGDYKAVLAATAAARKNLPGTAKTKPNQLAFYEYSARNGLGDIAWSSVALGLIKVPSLDSWGAKILRLVATVPGVDPGQAELALMRADFLEKNYASAAFHASNSLGLLLAPGAARHLISEAARSFLNAGDPAGGITFLRNYFPDAFGGDSTDNPAPSASADRVAASFVAGKVEERLWVAAYYLALLWQAKGEPGAAAILFLALTESAPSDGDSDGALWNWLDLTLKRIASADVDDLGSDPLLASIQAAPAVLAAPGVLTASVTDSTASSAARRPLEMGALVEASQRWKNASSFDDLIDGYNRGLLKEKDWNDALALFTLLGPRLSPSLRTKYLYLDGRLVELGLASTDPQNKGGDLDKAFARDNFGKIVADSGAEEYYRTMAAWRLGITPPYLLALPNLSAKTAPTAGQDQTATTVAAATSSASPSLASLPLINNYLAFDLDDLASTQALKYLGSPDKNLVASLAFKLSSEGQHYPALRLARDAINRGLGTQYPELYGLVYPRAWADIIAEGAAIPGIPEALAYAIIRSESVFDPTSVSYAGAVGLTQLMPSTASETAKGLKMKSYSLTDPRDNVRIGMTYYSYMLNRFGRKPIRAMFAYNAGPGRMQTWAKESGELPDDVLLETLNIAQPRQYAKNIIQAALAYGRVQYAIQAQDLLEYLVNAIPLPPAPALPEPAPSVPAAPELPAASASQAATASTASATDTSAETAASAAASAAAQAATGPSTDAAAQSQPGTVAAGIGATM